MLFASVELAANIEKAECSLMRRSAEAVTMRDASADVAIVPLAGGLATYLGPGSPLNKVAGLGFEGPLDESELEAIERLFHERGAPVQVELSILADPSIGAMLTGRGYVLVGFENVLGLSLPVASARPSEHDPDPTLVIEQVEGLDPWLDVIVESFLQMDTQGVESHESFDEDVMRAAFRDMSGAQGMTRYLATRNGVPAGGASMALSGKVVHLCGAGTRPDHRRRGIQRALLEQRLADATHLGGTLATVTTQPGSKSMANAQRQGFELLYPRAVLVQEPV